MSALRSSSIPLASLVGGRGIRAIHVSPLARAAVAPAPTPSTSSSANTARPSAMPIKKAAIARKPLATKTTPPSLLASASPASASASASASQSSKAPTARDQDDPYDFSDFPAPDEYASLAPPASKKSSPPDMSGPMPSPPLSFIPSSDYTPLPSASSRFSSSGGTTTASVASGENGIAGEVSAPAVFHGMSEKPFEKDTIEALLKPIHPDDVEVKPDGLLYLPEIKYRRTLNAAFGPGGWGMAPRGETNVGDRIVSREWGLVCLGRLVSIARGEQEYFDKSGIPTATEACKSNALMRCCKDLGIASELWDPRYIRDFKDKHCVEVFVEHATKKSKRKLWRKKKGPKFEYPWKET